MTIFNVINNQKTEKSKYLSVAQISVHPPTKTKQNTKNLIVMPACLGVEDFSIISKVTKPINATLHALGVLCCLT